MLQPKWHKGTVVLVPAKQGWIPRAVYVTMPWEPVLIQHLHPALRAPQPPSNGHSRRLFEFLLFLVLRRASCDAFLRKRGDKVCVLWRTHSAGIGESCRTQDWGVMRPVRLLDLQDVSVSGRHLRVSG